MRNETQPNYLKVLGFTIVQPNLRSTDYLFPFLHECMRAVGWVEERNPTQLFKRAVGWVEERNPTQLFKSVGFHYRSTQPTIY
ncbi:MAG: hypothetical protein DWQ58_24290 [Microcystis aeruginosa TA09]|nr:MAG: hypothetical protein DWQ58_24290 [Microcystis aeruginosa TA09]